MYLNLKVPFNFRRLTRFNSWWLYHHNDTLYINIPASKEVETVQVEIEEGISDTFTPVAHASLPENLMAGINFWLDNGNFNQQVNSKPPKRPLLRRRR